MILHAEPYRTAGTTIGRTIARKTTTGTTTIDTANTTMPAIFQLLCVLLKCAMLSHFLFRHAHSFPCTPRTIAQAKPKKGIKQRNAIQTLLKIPHIQVKTNAPQLHPLISSGTMANSPYPDVFSGVTPTLSPCPQSGQNMKSAPTSFPQLGQNGIASPPVPLIHHTRIKNNGQYRKFLNSRDTMPIRPTTNQVLCPQNAREKYKRE